MRLVRRADRARPEQARRRRGDREPRDRAGDGEGARRRSASRSSSAPSRPPATARGPPRPLTSTTTTSRRRRHAPAPRRRGAHACRSSLLSMVPALQFSGWEWLALALSTPVVLYARRRVPPRGAERGAARRRDDGHADLDRHARGLALVDGRARRRARRRHVLRGRRRRHDADPARPLPRGAREAALGRGDPRGCSSSARRRRASSATAREVLVPIAELRVGDRLRRAARARRSRPTASSRRARRRSTSRC